MEETRIHVYLCKHFQLVKRKEDNQWNPNKRKQEDGNDNEYDEEKDQLFIYTHILFGR